MKLAPEYDDALYRPGTAAKVLGWGLTDDSDPASGSENQLRGAAVTVAPAEECAQRWSLRGERAEQVVCAGGPRDGKDACHGDSGGPLLAGDTVIGVVSFGDDCQEAATENAKPGAYTRVQYYLEKDGAFRTAL